MVGNYNKYIADSRSVIYISTLIALLLRWYFFRGNSDLIYFHENIFSEKIFPLVFSNNYIQFFLGFIFNVGIAFIVGHINEKFGIISGRTYLPYAFTMFLLSCSPYFTYPSTAYISLVLLLLSIKTLFSSYQEPESAKYFFQIGVFLSSSAFFFPEMLAFIPVFWLGSSIMRNFSLKGVLASLLAVIMIAYFAVFINYLGSSNVIVSWLKHFNLLIDYSITPFSEISVRRWVVFLITTIIAVIVLLYDYIYSYKDKVQTRSYLKFVNVLFFFSGILFVAMKMSPLILLMIVLTLSAFIYSHFFAQVNNKLEVFLFYFVLLVYFLNFMLLGDKI